MEPDVRNKIGELTNRITWLTEDFQKVSYPPIKSIEEENKRKLDPTITQCTPPFALSGFPKTASDFSVFIKR